jgi:hypothetical protein
MVEQMEEAVAVGSLPTVLRPLELSRPLEGAGGSEQIGAGLAVLVQAMMCGRAGVAGAPALPVVPSGVQRQPGDADPLPVVEGLDLQPRQVLEAGRDQIR